MARRLMGRSLVVATCLLALLGTGCTPDPPPPAPPTSTSPTPTENAQEREERLAYDAAETSYREFRGEVERVYSRGGATKPTEAMTATAGGSYLASYQQVSEAYHNLKHRSKGPLTIAYVRRSGYNPSELILDTCEDLRKVVTYDNKGRKLYSGDVRKLQLTARLVRGSWKIWSGKGRQVSMCE